MHIGPEASCAHTYLRYAPSSTCAQHAHVARLAPSAHAFGVCLKYRESVLTAELTCACAFTYPHAHAHVRTCAHAHVYAGLRVDVHTRMCKYSVRLCLTVSSRSCWNAGSPCLRNSALGLRAARAPRPFGVSRTITLWCVAPALISCAKGGRPRLRRARPALSHPCPHSG